VIVDVIPTSGHLYFTPYLKTQVAAGVNEVCSVEVPVEMTAKSTADFSMPVTNSAVDYGVMERSLSRALDISAESSLVLEYNDYCYKVIFNKWSLQNENNLPN